jgi:hypothetical protein
MLIAGTGGDGRRRVNAASRSHCAGCIPICSALPLNVSNSDGETLTPIVEVLTLSGSPLGRPPFDFVGICSIILFAQLIILIKIIIDY